jgi:hypothetical protein
VAAAQAAARSWTPPVELTAPAPSAEKTDRNTVYGYPWYTDVRKTLEDPAYADWFFKFKPQCLSNSSACFSKRCDKAQPSLCSDLFHEQEQSPGFPRGDGDCLAPGCDCGKVPCECGKVPSECAKCTDSKSRDLAAGGFYIWNHSSTTVVKGQTFQDWFIHDYILNEVRAANKFQGGRAVLLFCKLFFGCPVLASAGWDVALGLWVLLGRRLEPQLQHPRPGAPDHCPDIFMIRTDDEMTRNVGESKPLLGFLS